MAVQQRFGRPDRSRDPLLAEEDRQRKTRRSWAILIVVVFVVLLIVTNLPRTATLSGKQAQFTALRTEVSNDLLGCNTAIRDAFDALQAVRNHVSKYEKTVGAIFSQDQAECTIINSDLLDLVEANPPAVLARLGVQPGLNHYYKWAFPNADALIAYSNSLAQNLSSQKLKLDILGRFNSMAKNLTLANNEFASVASKLHMKYVPIRLYGVSNVPKGLI